MFGCFPILGLLYFLLFWVFAIYHIIPRYPAFVVNGITSVWKRFYIGYCQLQILFDQQTGNAILSDYQSNNPNSNSNIHNPLFWEERLCNSTTSTTNTIKNKEEGYETWQNKAIPWQLLLEIVNVLFESEFEDVAGLKSSLARYSRTSIIRIYISLVDIYLVLINTSPIP